MALLEKDPVADIPLARRAGLDPDAVREAIGRVARERDLALEQGRELHAEASRLREELDEARRELEEARREAAALREREAAVGEALVVANNVAAGIREEAERRAAQAEEEARRRAEELVAEAQARADQRLREAAIEAAAMAEATRSHIDRLRGEEEAVARTARDIALTLRDMADALERAVEGAGGEEPELTEGDADDGGLPVSHLATDVADRGDAA